MAGRLVIGDIRVQEVVRGDGRRAYTIVLPDGEVCGLPDRFLRRCQGGTDRTYAYLLVDHLRWLAAEGLTPETVTFPDLERYMAAVGAECPGPFGRPWREGRRPYGQSALSTTAACLKGFYVFQGSQGLGRDVAEAFKVSPAAVTGGPPPDVPRARGDRDARESAGPGEASPPSPKMPPEGARKRLTETLPSARDRMTVTWLADGGFRVGEFCGLHLADLHLREAAGCGECRSPHVHVCHREANPNRARAKTKHGWRIEDGIVHGGLIRRASPAMIHAYFEYMTAEYPPDAGHGMLLVQLHGPRAGEPWAPAGVRGMLRRAGIREELGRIRPHEWRHWIRDECARGGRGQRPHRPGRRRVGVGRHRGAGLRPR